MKKRVTSFLLSLLLVFSSALSVSANEIVESNTAKESQLVNNEEMQLDAVTNEENQEIEETTEELRSDVEENGTEQTVDAEADSVISTFGEIRASGQWEVESNNTMNSADKIYPNTSVNGNIMKDDDVDFYKFTIGSKGYLSLTLNHSYIDNGNNYWYIKLCRPDGSAIYEMGVAGNNTSKRSCRIGLPAGTYYVQVSSHWYYWSDLNYNLRVNYVSADYWETEDNNTLSTFNSIATNKSVTGSNMSSDDIDWYKFTIGSKGYLSLTLNHSYIDNGNNYWYVKLCRPDGSAIYEMGVAGNNTSKRSCRIGLPAGTYYVQVSSHWNYWSDLDYNLRVNYVSAGYWETESNDTQSTSDSIAPNASVTGSLMSSEDNDYYKFQTKSQGYISITLNHAYIDNGHNYWNVRLFRQSDGTLIHEAQYQGNQTSQKSCRIGLPAGTYYVQVSSDWYYWSDVDYNLRVNYVTDKSYETELNDSINTADAITKNVVSRGTLMSGDDQDYYTFTLASKCYVNFRLTHGYIDDRDSYFNFTLSNSNNAPLLSYSLSGTETGTNKGMVLKPGRYYIKISKGWNHSATPYGLLVQPVY